MKAGWRVWAFATVVAGVAATVWYFSLPYCYVASCELAFSYSDIVTNGLGHATVSGKLVENGLCDDCPVVAEKMLEMFLGKKAPPATLVDGYLKARQEHLSYAPVVSNAFVRVEYNVAGGTEMAAVRLSVVAESRDVALGVCGFVADRYCQFVEDRNRQLADKVLSELRSKIARAKSRNEDVSHLMKSVEVLKRDCERQWAKTIVLKPPYVETEGKLL